MKKKYYLVESRFVTEWGHWFQGSELVEVRDGLDYKGRKFDPYNHEAEWPCGESDAGHAYMLVTAEDVTCMPLEEVMALTECCCFFAE